jgi:hypothetical protein
MTDAIHDGHLREIEWAYPAQASHVYGIQILVRSSLMMFEWFSGPAIQAFVDFGAKVFVLGPFSGGHGALLSCFAQS